MGNCQTSEIKMVAKKSPAKKPAKKASGPKKTAKKKTPAKKSAKKSGAKKSPGKKDKKDKVKRAPSAYNLFVKAELAKLKKSHPKSDHKERFAMAAANWKKA